MKEIGRHGIEAYLKKQVAKAGGVCRDFKSRIHNPDQLVIWPRYRKTKADPLTRYPSRPEIHFVETKAPRKGPRPGQAREHKRLRALGCEVFVINTKEQVDAYVDEMR